MDHDSDFIWTRHLFKPNPNLFRLNHSDGLAIGFGRGCKCNRIGEKN